MAKSIKKHRYHFPEPVQILSGKLNDVFRLHSHDFIEIAFINDGSGEYIDNYGQLFLVPGDLFIMRGEDDYHGFLDMKSLEVINIIFEPGSLDLPYDQLRTITGYNILFEIGLPPGAAKRRPFMNLLPGILQQLQDYVNRIRGELKDKQPGYRIKLRNCLLDIIILLSRTYDKSTVSELPPRDYNFGRTIAYIQSHVQERYTLDRLARDTCLSKPHLIRKFKQITGLPPIDYINRARINLACKMLIRENCSISEAASACGFQESNYFARVFKKFKKVSPRQYLRTQRREQISKHFV